MRLVPVFILETYVQTNYKTFPQFVLYIKTENDTYCSPPIGFPTSDELQPPSKRVPRSDEIESMFGKSVYFSGQLTDI